MRYFDEDEAKKLGAEQWQVDLLSLNPSYLGWGPHEDYMAVKGEGWNSRIIKSSWAEFGPFQLDDLNECVNFYFSVERDSADCHMCGGDGYVYGGSAARACLTLWMLHPRKGCSRGVEVSDIKQSDLPAVTGWLKAAAARNADRFSKIAAL